MQLVWSRMKMHILRWQSLRTDSLLEPPADIRGTAGLGTFHSDSFLVSHLDLNTGADLLLCRTFGGILRVWPSRPSLHVFCGLLWWRVVCGQVWPGWEPTPPSLSPGFSAGKWCKDLSLESSSILGSYSHLIHRWRGGGVRGGPAGCCGVSSNSGGLLIYAPPSPPLMGYGWWSKE